MKQFLMVLCVLLVMGVTAYFFIGSLPVYALNGLIDLGNQLEALCTGVL